MTFEECWKTVDPLKMLPWEEHEIASEAWAAAIAEEREACAKLALSHCEHQMTGYKEGCICKSAIIYAAIRARKP